MLLEKSVINFTGGLIHLFFYFVIYILQVKLYTISIFVLVWRLSWKGKITNPTRNVREKRTQVYMLLVGEHINQGHTPTCPT